MLLFTGNLNDRGQKQSISFFGTQANDEGFEEEELSNMETLGMYPYLIIYRRLCNRNIQY